MSESVKSAEDPDQLYNEKDELIQNTIQNAILEEPRFAHILNQDLVIKNYQNLIEKASFIKKLSKYKLKK